MPIESLEEQQANAPVTGSSTPTPTLPPIPTLPPPPGTIPTPLNMPTGLRGRARWDALLRTFQTTGTARLFGTDKWDWQRWVSGLPDDPSDPEYQSLLNAARLMDHAPPGSGPPPKPRELGGPAKDALGKTGATESGSNSGYPIAADAGGETIVQRGYKTGTGTGTTPVDPSVPAPVGDILDEEKKLARKLEQDRRKREQMEKTPIFKGAPVPGDVISEEGEIEDPYLRQFFTKHGITLEPGDSDKKLTSGEWVYMGTETDTDGVTRPVYVYKDQAHNAVVNLPGKKIAAYQKALGLAVTGRPDPYIEQYWDAAVATAQRYAAAGQRVSVQEIFDSYISSAIAKRNASGGGGGGGGGGPDPLSTDDFYMAMMGVLGDISGVEG